MAVRYLAIEFAIHEEGFNRVKAMIDAYTGFLATEWDVESRLLEYKGQTKLKAGSWK
jgi:hypothetical protein